MKRNTSMKPTRWIGPTLFALVALFNTSCVESSDGVVNADIAGSSNEIYVAGYMSGCSCEEGGFIKQRIDGKFETVYESAFELWGIWVGGDDAVAAVGWNTVVTYDGQWHETEVESDSLHAVWGTDLDNLFVVGYGGAIFHFDGNTWTEMDTPTTTFLRGIWGTDAQNVFAVGESGTILHYDGDAWSTMESNTTEDINDIWGLDADTVYAVGGSETTKRRVILRLDGNKWDEELSGDGFHLLGIHGASETEIYAVGAQRSGDSVNSAVLRFDGTEWTRQSPGIHQFLWDVYAPGDNGFYVVGPDNTLKQLH